MARKYKVRYTRRLDRWPGPVVWLCGVPDCRHKFQIFRMAPRSVAASLVTEAYTDVGRRRGMSGRVLFPVGRAALCSSRFCRCLWSSSGIP